MEEIVLPPNHVQDFIDFLQPYFPDIDIRNEGWEEGYDGTTEAIVVKDGGLKPHVAHTYWNCLTTFEVLSRDRIMAFELACKVDALMRITDVASYVGALNAPTYSNDSDYRIPSYTWTMEHFMRGTKVSLENL